MQCGSYRLMKICIDIKKEGKFDNSQYPIGENIVIKYQFKRFKVYLKQWNLQGQAVVKLRFLNCI